MIAGDAARTELARFCLVLLTGREGRLGVRVGYFASGLASFLLASSAVSSLDSGPMWTIGLRGVLDSDAASVDMGLTAGPVPAGGRCAYIGRAYSLELRRRGVIEVIGGCRVGSDRNCVARIRCGGVRNRDCGVLCSDAKQDRTSLGCLA